MNEIDERDVAALRVLCEEAREEPHREVDWDRVERGLMAAIAARESRSRAATPRASSPILRAFGFAAAAAVLVFGVASSGSSAPSRSAASLAPASHAVDPSSVAMATGKAGEEGDRDLLALRPGDVVEATTDDVRFGHDGALAWTLAKGSALHVKSTGSDGVGQVVVLDRGSIHAEVVPRAASEGLVEAFAVEVEGTRVAVHGTSFTVTREGDRVVVDVAHGAIAVGPTGHAGETSGHLMIGPSRAAFSFDGGKVAKWLARPAAEAPIATASMASSGADDSAAANAKAMVPQPATRPEPPAIALGVAHEAPKTPAAPRANEPPVEVVEGPVAPPPPLLTTSSIRAGLQRCLERTHPSIGDGVKIEISTTVHVVVAEDGSIAKTTVNPPLKPEFQECAGDVIRGRMEKGARSIDIPISNAP